MVRELYLIVHEESVRASVRRGFPKGAKRVLERINEIKKSKRFITHDGDENELPQEMPPPAEDLFVIVAGAYVGMCLAEQQKVLVNKGYQVKYEESACLQAYMKSR